MNAPVTATAANLTADDMAIAAALNTGSGSITAVQSTNGRAVDLGTNTAGKLSLTQAELDNLVTTGPLNIGNFNTGAITVSAPLTATLPSAVNVQGTSITQNAAVNVSSPLTVTTDNVTINSTLTVAASVTLQPRSFGRPINLGAAADSGTAIDLSAAELNSVVTPVLRIGSSSAGPVTIVNSIAPANAGTFTLTSGFGSNITQSVGATLTHPDVALNAFSGSVIMPEANSVGTLAGSASGFGGQFKFANAAGTPLTIGTVDGTTGVRFNNSSGTINLIADNLNVASPVSAPFFNGAVIIQPAAAATKLDLGGADAAGVLGISAAELLDISATTLTFKADQADISAPVSSAASTLVIAPLTAGRALNTIVGVKNALNLEFVQADLSNVTANSLVLGDAATGPVAISAATAVPATVGTFTLRSGDAVSGITVNNALSATGSLNLNADAMALNAGVSTTGGSISITTNTAGRPIDLGSNAPGALGLTAAELTQLSAPLGTLFFGNAISGDLTVSAPVTLAQNTTLTANVMNINALLTTTTGDITVVPAASRNIALGTADIVGSTLGLVNSEINNLDPGSGLLRIGDFSNTNSINVTAAIAPANATTLSLLANSSISQTAGSTIAETNLRASTFGSVTLNEPLNAVGTLAGSSFGSFSFTNNIPLIIGTVDGIAGISDSAVNLRSNEIAINDPISASSLTLRPLTAGTLIDVGTNVGGRLSVDQTELDNIFANSVTIGDSASGNLVVSAPVDVTSFSDLNLITGASRTASVNAALTVQGNLNITAGTAIITADVVTSNFGNVTMVSDAMNLGAPVNAPSGTIFLQPFNATTDVQLGVADAVATTNTLGLDATDLGNLTAAAFSFGSNTTPSVTVAAATNLGATPTALVTQATGTINVDTPLSSGDLTLITDNLVIPAPLGSITAPNVTLETVTAGRTVDLGTAITGTALGLDQAQLNRISTSGFTIDNLGLINVSAPVSFSVANLTLLGDTMTIGSTVTNTAGGRIIVAPASNFRGMDLGTNPVAGKLGLSQVEVTRFITSGVLQFGETDINTGSINISNPIAPSAGISALVLASNGPITQGAGKTITTSNLGIQSFSSVNLPENNNVGTLAGFSSGSFAFTANGPLTIGTVDGVNGISDSTVTIKSDTLTISQPISGFNVTLAPRNAGAPMDLGSKPAGVFGVTDAEMDLISGFFMTFGNSSTGPVTVSSPMTRTSGFLNIITGSTQPVNINAALSADFGISVTGGSTNVFAPITSDSGGVTIVSDSMNIVAPITSASTVTLRPVTAARPIELGTENASALSLTDAELDQINASSPTSNLTIGSTAAGPLNISAPISPAGGTDSTSLSLLAGGNITQSLGATIVTKREIVDSETGLTTVTGSLNVVSGNGNVFLPEENDVGLTLSGSVSAVNSTFDFNNVGPLKLQHVNIFPSPSAFVAIATRPVRVNAGFFAFVPTEGLSESVLDALNFAVGEINRSTEPLLEEQKEETKDEKANMCTA